MKPQKLPFWMHSLRPFHHRPHVVIITDAGFQSAWFSSCQIAGMGFYWSCQRDSQIQTSQRCKESWLNIKMCKGRLRKKYLGTGTLARSKHSQCDGHFYLYKKESAGRKSKRPEEKPGSPKTEKEQKASAREPWLIFNSTDEFKACKIIRLYSEECRLNRIFGMKK